MLTFCIRCEEPFETEDLELNLCPRCEAELRQYDSNEYYTEDGFDSVDEGSYPDDSFNN